MPLARWLAAMLATAASLAGAAEVKLPPPATLEYALRSGVLSGTGVLAWQPRGDRYTLTMQGSALGLTLLSWSSRGALGAGGLVPEHFSDRRLTRPARTAELDRAAGVVRYGGYKPEHRGELPLAGDAQDRLSWMVQLPALLAANPALRQAGRSLTMFVTGARRDVDRWTFVVQGHQSVALGDGATVDALYLKRAQDEPGDTQSEAWLDPARGYLPLRARLSNPDKDEAIELTLRRVP